MSGLAQWLETATTVTVTAALLPFMQSLATQAGARMFDVGHGFMDRTVRRLIERGAMVERSVDEHGGSRGR